MRNMTMRLLCVAVTAACLAAPALAADFYPIDTIAVTTATDDLWPAVNLIQGAGAGFDANEPHDALPQPNDQGLWVTAAPGGFPSDYIEETGKPVFDIDLGTSDSTFLHLGDGNTDIGKPQKARQIQ